MIQTDRAYPRWFFRALYVLIALAILIRLFYWGYADRTWEDALITVLHSENAVRGLGLTHLQPPGQPPLHGFTSPLSVLIPLAGDFLHLGWGLPLIKLVSAVCGGIAVWLGARICQALGLSPATTLIAAAFLAFEHQQILWGMAGMETQIVTVAYFCCIYSLLRGNQWQKGLALGFAMLARPDAAFLVLIAFIVELWRAKKSRSWLRLGPVIYGFILLYGPWILFTFLYYGSPVPNTVIAKSMGYPPPFPRGVPLASTCRLLQHRFLAVIGTLGPAYGGHGTGLIPFWDHFVIASLMVLLLVIGLIIALRKRHTDALIVYSVAVVYILYLTFCPSWIAGWYTAPVVAIAIIGSVYGLWSLTSGIEDISRRELVIGAVGVAYLITIVSILPITIPSDKHIQEYVENGNRKQLGLYLAKVSSPNDTIATESLGYIGYYSNRVIYDYPGLCSRVVVNYLRSHPDPRDHNLTSMMQALRPTYLVLRPQEYENAQGQSRFPWIDEDYQLVRVFRVPDSERKKMFHPEMSADMEFDVFRKKDSGKTMVTGNGPA